MMLRLSAILTSIALLAVPAVGAAANRQLPGGYKWGRCLLEVNGKTYLSGQRCAYLVEKDGSFEIIDPNQLLGDTGYFALVNLEGALAEGWWNEEPLASHAQAPLGKLTRRGACWINKQARICLWCK